MKIPNWCVVPAFAVLLPSSSALAGLVGVSLGTAAPPTSVGGIDLTPFVADPTPIGDPLSSVALPPLAGPTGDLVFDADVYHYTVDPLHWQNWNNGFTGDVYAVDTLFSTDGVDPITLMLPSGTKAFYFYVLPGPWAPINFDVHAKGSGGATDVVDFSGAIDGAVASQGFAFYTDGVTDVSSVTITGYYTGIDGYAVGEFGINGQPPIPGTPDGGATAFLLGGSALMLAFLRRRLAR